MKWFLMWAGILICIGCRAFLEIPEGWPSTLLLLGYSIGVSILTDGVRMLLGGE